MPRLTRREAALGFMSQAPLDMDTPPIPPKRAKAKHPEVDLQAACVQYLRIKEKQGKLRFYAAMSEGKRNPKRAGWFKSMGAQRGFPDLLILRRNPPRVIFIELKAEDGRLSEAQTLWRDWLQSAGFPWHLVRSVSHLTEILEPHL